VIIGLGTDTGGDDAVGLLVARRLRELGLEVLDYSGEVLGLLDLWEGAESVCLVDAMCSGRPVGFVCVFDAREAPFVSGEFPLSTHGLGLFEALGLAEQLGRLPRRVVVYGIEGRNFAPGDEISPEVLSAVEEVAGRIARGAASEGGA
jgi:hydrogenase maturation protease